MATENRATSDFRMSEYYHGELRHEFLPGVLIEEGDFLVRRTSDGINVISVKWDKKLRNYKPDFDGETFWLVLTL